MPGREELPSEKAMTWLPGSQYVLRNAPGPVLVIPDTG